MQLIGIQDASTKRRVDNGLSVGTIYNSTATSTSRSVTSEKWMKGKNYLLDLKEKLNDSSDNFLSYKHLESIRGFFYHLAMTFGILFLYLKGFHRTLCSHLPKRDEEGWKMKDLEWIGHLDSLHSKKLISRDDIDDAIRNLSGGVPAPRMIKVFPRFHQCLRSLLTLLFSDVHPKVMDRSKRITLLVHGLADTSKGGLGASFDCDGNIKFRIGTWGSNSEDESSIWREFTNVVESLEELVPQVLSKDQL